MNDQLMNSMNCLESAEKSGLVEVVYAKSMLEAIGYRDWLLELNIPAQLESPGGSPSRTGIAVLVPPAELVPALEALAERPDIDEDEEEDEEEFEDDDFNDGDEEDDDDYEEEEEDDDFEDEGDVFDDDEDEEEEYEDDEL